MMNKERESMYSLDSGISQYVEREDAIRSRPNSFDDAETSSQKYDYCLERRTRYATTLIESIAHMIKGCLGAGVLGIHEAFMRGGIWTSLVATLVIGLVVPYIMLMLVKSAHKMYERIHAPRLSYPELAEAAVATGPVKKLRRFSKVIRYTVDTCLFIEMCGSCCVFQIMIAQTIKQVLESMSTQMKVLDMSLRIYIVVTAAPLVLICLIRSLKWLAPFSLFADLFVGICVAGTIFYSISSATDITKRPAWKGVEGLFAFFGTCLYSIQGITIALPIENNMKSPKYFALVLQCGMATVVVVVGAVGFFGYWVLGETCDTPITIHLPLGPAADCLHFFLAFMLAVSFAIHFWVPFRIVWHYIGKRHRRNRGVFERIYRSLLVIVISCVAVVFPQADHMMSLLGAIFCAFAGFVFPASIETLVTWRQDGKKMKRWRITKNIFIMIFGTALCCGSVYSFIVSNKNY